MRTNCLRRNQKSCGCATKNDLGARSFKHGKTKTKEYQAYVRARQRCNNEKHPQYHNYGGRGIKFCFNNFEEFFNEVGKAPTDSHSIERMNNEKHYESGNVCWSTKVEQANNRRTNRVITYNGETHTLAQWAKKLNLSYKSLFARLYRGNCFGCAITGNRQCQHKIVLDIDGVCADFLTAIIKEAVSRGLEFPSSPEEIKEWGIHENFEEVFNSVKYCENFWLSLPVLEKPNFTPMAYLTARPCCSEITWKWLKQNDFPLAQVISVENAEDKLTILKNLKCEIFVDDYHKTVVEVCNNSDISTFLMSAPHNKNLAFNNRIETLRELGSDDFWGV